MAVSQSSSNAPQKDQVSGEQIWVQFWHFYPNKKWHIY